MRGLSLPSACAAVVLLGGCDAGSASSAPAGDPVEAALAVVTDPGSLTQSCDDAAALADASWGRGDIAGVKTAAGQAVRPCRGVAARFRELSVPTSVDPGVRALRDDCGTAYDARTRLMERLAEVRGVLPHPGNKGGPLIELRDTADAAMATCSSAAAAFRLAAGAPAG
jgi:hypothetical protein